MLKYGERKEAGIKRLCTYLEGRAARCAETERNDDWQIAVEMDHLDSESRAHKRQVRQGFLAPRRHANETSGLRCCDPSLDTEP